MIKRAPSVKISPEDIQISNLHGEIGTPVTLTVTGNPIDLNFLALSKIVEITSSATLRIEYYDELGNPIGSYDSREIFALVHHSP